MSRSKQKTAFLLDMHCHILPEVDDGAKDMKEAMEMLHIAWQEGITHIICTPHYKNHRRSVSGQALTKAFQNFKAQAEQSGCDISLYLGNEIFYFRDLEQAIDEGKIQGMNGSGYFLVEFYPKDSYTTIRNGLDDIQSLGFTPVLAHIERYECLTRQFAYVEELYQMGVHIQVNAASIMGELGLATKLFTRKLLKLELVDYIGTDAHSAKGRAPKMTKCRDYLYKKYEKQYIDAILYKNAVRDFGLQ